MYIDASMLLQLTLEHKKFLEGGKRAALKGIFAIKYHRIVLDEAHAIRTPKTGVFAAACALQATYRWALTGTILVNKVRSHRA